MLKHNIDFHDPEVVKALVDALRHDPFYRSILGGIPEVKSEKDKALERYFAYSMTEGIHFGQLVVSPDRTAGAAVWLLPESEELVNSQRKAKQSFLEVTLGVRGAQIYRDITIFMKSQVAVELSNSAWYLSIIGVAPSMQGRGVGTQLLASTLQQADEHGVNCFLETFDSRNATFYQRLGFATTGVHLEPTVRASYSIMVRQPRSRNDLR